MAERLQSCKGREALRKLRRAGFVVVRISGSAHYLRHPVTGRFTSIHLYGAKEIPIALLHKIVSKQAGLTVEEWNRL